jgi:hypothetical protein
MIVRVFVASVLLSLASQSAWAEDMCGELPCRANGVPYITENGSIIVFAGESFWVEVKIEGDKVVGLVPRKGREVAGAIMVELAVRGGGSALLWGNQLDRPVLFDATMTAPRRESLAMQKCPLPPKRYTYDVYPFVVEAVEIGNFRFAPAEGVKCD